MNNNERIFRSGRIGSTHVMTSVVLMLLALVHFNAMAQLGGWTKKRDIPTPRIGSVACVVNGEVYLLGGYNATGMQYTTNQKYDPVTDSWQTKQAMPTARGFLSAAAVDGNIYAIGGGYPVSTNKVEAYDPVTDTWTARRNMLGDRLGAHAAVVDRIIYNIGGNYSERNCEAYDPATDTWTAKSPMPEAGGVVAVAVHNELIYVFGGGYYSVFNTVFVYDPRTDQWTKKASMGAGRFAFRAYPVDGKIYAIGGAPSQNQSSSTVEVYDPATDTWETKVGMPEQAAWFAGAVVGGKVYVMGGTPDWQTGGTSVWEYDPAFHTDVAGGSVSGTWTRVNSPYRVSGEIIVPNAASLIIEPGTDVIFEGHYKFNVQGRILAVGTDSDPITFTSADTTTGWHGMRFIGTPGTNDSSELVHCLFTYGKANTGNWSSSDRCAGALMIDGFGKVLVKKCSFERNMNSGDIGATGGAAVFVRYASPLITENTFSHNTGTTDCALMSCYSDVIVTDNVFTGNSGCHGPITCAYGYCAPIITGNRISHNVTTRAGGGIFTITSTAFIANNIITHNSCFGVEGEGGGIKCWMNDRAVIINNTVAFNSATHGGGICCNENADPIFINNIIWGNSSSDGSQVNCIDVGSDPAFCFSDVQGGREAFGGAGAGVQYSGVYESNIELDPLFSDTASGDLCLSAYSPCIGAGADSLTTGQTTYRCPPLCIMGMARPTPEFSGPDIGACENARANPLTEVGEPSAPLPTAFALHQNYPNPFNPTTVVSSQLPVASDVKLVVYDVLGREVAVLVHAWRCAGSYQDAFEASGLASGVYIYRLTAGQYVETRTMILMK